MKQQRAPVMRWFSSLLTLLVAACATHAPPQPIPARVTLVSPAAQRGDSVAPALPAMPVDQITGPQSERIEEFHASDEDLHVVLREIAQAFRLDYRIAPEVRGRVNVRLQSATLDDALRAIIRPHGFDYQLQDRVLYVGPAQVESRLFSLDYVALARVGQSSTVIQRRLGTNTGFGNINNQSVAGNIGNIAGQGAFGGGGDVITSVSVADLWEEIRVALEALVFATASAGDAARVGGGTTLRTSAFSRVDSAGRTLVINPMAGTILVHAPRRVLNEIDAFLRVFEASVQRQVLIEAKIVEVQLNRGHEYGIDWSAVQRIGSAQLRVGNAATQSGGLQFTLSGGSGTITALLRTLSEQGDVRVLSSPQVSALNNQRAIFNVTTDEIIFTVSRQPIIGPNGTTIGFTNQIETNQIAVGIVLDVFPQISPDNTVSMNIRPAITNVSRVETIQTEDGSEARAPVIDRREIDTFARVRPGETIVIGGLMQTRRERRRTGVPILKDVPVLGYLFGRTTDTETRGELVIFITPTIVSGQLREGG